MLLSWKTGSRKQHNQVKSRSSSSHTLKHSLTSNLAKDADKCADVTKWSFTINHKLQLPQERLKDQYLLGCRIWNVLFEMLTLQSRLMFLSVFEVPVCTPAFTFQKMRYLIKYLDEHWSQDSVKPKTFYRKLDTKKTGQEFAPEFWHGR